MSKFALSSALVVLLSPLAAAQTPLELLSKVAANYTSLSKTSYDFEQVEIREFSLSQSKSEQRLRIAGSGGKYRQETLPSGTLWVADGQFRWAYNRDRNEYTKTPAKPGIATGLSTFSIAAFRLKSARFLRQETLELAAGPVVCQVIEAEKENTDERIQNSPVTYWIDAARNLILKMKYTVTINDSSRPSPVVQIITVSVLKATVGQPVEEALFRFTPLPDATQVERLTFGPKSPLVGKFAADFELKGVNGEAITSLNLRGNVVLLQFSQTADDDALLLLEMAYRSLRSKGLMAFYVLPPRTQPVPGSQMFTVPVATDPGGIATKQFGIGYVGTILIDRLGKIAYAGSSPRNSLELATALQKLGMW